MKELDQDYIYKESIRKSLRECGFSEERIEKIIERKTHLELKDMAASLLDDD